MPIPLLPVITAGAPLLIRFLSVAFIVGLISRILLALGLTYFAFTGVDAAVDILQDLVNQNLSGTSANIKALLDMSGLTTVLTWLMTAQAFKLLVQTSKFALFRTKMFK